MNIYRLKLAWLSGEAAWPSPTQSPFPLFLLVLSYALTTPLRLVADEAAENLPNQLGSRRVFRQSVEPLIRQYCCDCHGGGASEGGRTLDQFGADELLSSHDAWHGVWTNLRSQIMPPSDAEQPSDQDRQLIIDWIERHVFQLDPKQPDPGRVIIRRLNREEYRHTIFDLLGVEFDTTEEFPPDDTSHGFDTIGGALHISPLLFEKFLQAARKIVTEAIPAEAPSQDGNADNKLAYQRIFVEGPPRDDAELRLEYSREILRRLADKAFRRPVDELTLGRLVALAMDVRQSQGKTFEESIAHATAAILISPRFLFRAECLHLTDSQARYLPLDDYALASRLSYFLWSSLPDDELMGLAAKSQLREHLRDQVDRMLSDDRSQRLVANFVGQWLRTRDLEGKYIDAEHVLKRQASSLKPGIFSRQARKAMREETELLVAYLLDENRSIDELLTANYSFLNEVLARIYGIDGVEGREMRRVDLPESCHRGGILTHAGVLLVTSNPRRTSPVKRGQFILENLLGTPAPPAPPDIPSLEDSRKKVKGNTTMRQLMQQHRADPLCASCHARMDPLGLALENYGALGTWRDSDRGAPIVTRGQLITGESFDNVQELASLIVHERRRDYYRCVTEKLFAFAIGRGVEYYDAPAIERIVDALERDGGRARTLVYGIVECVAFQNCRRGEADQP